MGSINIRIGNAFAKRLRRRIVNLNAIAFAQFAPDPRGDVARIFFIGGAETEFKGEEARIFWGFYRNCSQKLSAHSGSM